MIRIASVILVSASLVACSFGSVSKTPVQLSNGEFAYRYEGRANFAHQNAEADRMMAEHCRSINGGFPVIVDARQSVVGAARLGQANTTLSGTSTAPGSFNASATTNSSVNTLANRQQSLLFRCVRR